MKSGVVAEIYLQSAMEALNAGNYAAAEADADKMIETDPHSYRAWFIKGEAAGWQTTGTNNRFTESTAYWINAYQYAPKNKKREIGLQILNSAEKITTAILTMRCNNFKALRDENCKTGILDCLSIIGGQFTAIRDKTQIEIYTTALKNTFAGILNTTAAEVGKAINGEFGEDSKTRVRLGRTARPHSKLSWEHLIESTDCCLALLETAYYLSTDDGLCFEICKNYIELANLTKETCSGRRTPKKYRFVPGSGIPGSPVKYGPEEISQWERKKDLHDPEKQNNK